MNKQTQTTEKEALKALLKRLNLDILCEDASSIEFENANGRRQIVVEFNRNDQITAIYS